MKPFVSDGCSGWFDGFWVNCCYAHDEDYYKGGTKEERKLSDQRLRFCVYKIVSSRYGKPVGYVWSSLMYYGVRIFGAPWWPWMNARWGFKRTYKRGNLGYEEG